MNVLRPHKSGHGYYWATIRPGSRVYRCLNFLFHPEQTYLRSRTRITYVNVRPLVQVISPQGLYFTFRQINTLYDLGIHKPTNRQFNRPHVWQVDRPELVQFMKEDEAYRWWHV